VETLWRHRPDDDLLIVGPVHSSVEGLYRSTNRHLGSLRRSFRRLVRTARASVRESNCPTRVGA